MGSATAECVVCLLAWPIAPPSSCWCTMLAQQLLTSEAIPRLLKLFVYDCSTGHVPLFSCLPSFHLFHLPLLQLISALLTRMKWKKKERDASGNHLNSFWVVEVAILYTCIIYTSCTCTCTVHLGQIIHVYTCTVYVHQHQQYSILISWPVNYIHGLCLLSPSQQLSCLQTLLLIR